MARAARKRDASECDDDERQRLTECQRSTGAEPKTLAATTARKRRRRAEVLGMVKMNVAIALLNAGYWPTEMLKTALFQTVGYNSSALIYFFFGLCAFTTPWVVARLGVKYTVCLGAVPYFVFLLATEGVLSTIGTADGERWAPGKDLLNITIVGCYYGASVLLGFAASPLRTGSAVYVRSRALGYDAARDPGARARNSLGFFAGINNAAFGVSSFMFVSLIGIAVRNGVDYRVLYLVCAVSIAISLPLFATVPTTVSISHRYPILDRGREEDELPTAESSSLFAVCNLLRQSSKFRWLIIPAISSSVQEAYFVGSFNADVISPAVGLEWVGFLDAIMIVISSIISPVVGRLSDLHGRLPWYFTGLAINICSLLFVAARGSNMSLQTIICFSVLRGLAGATRTIIRAIMSEEFDDMEATAAFSGSTVVGMLGSSAFFAIGPYFSIKAKSLLATMVAVLAGWSVHMAIGPTCFKRHRSKAGYTTTATANVDDTSAC